MSILKPGELPSEQPMTFGREFENGQSVRADDATRDHDASDAGEPVAGKSGRWEWPLTEKLGAADHQPGTAICGQ
jgi:hypothetical protein